VASVGQENAAIEKSEIDCIGHSLIATIVGMEIVLRSEASQQSAGMIWIAQDRIEIDHGIKRAAGPDPFIELLPIYFLGFRVVAREVYTFKRTDRCPNQLDSVGMSAGDQLAESFYQVLRSADISWIGKIAPVQLCAGSWRPSQ
jgi:hypothetical protein